MSQDVKEEVFDIDYSFSINLLQSKKPEFTLNFESCVDEEVKHRIILQESERKFSWRKWKTLSTIKWYQPKSWSITDFSRYKDSFEKFWKVMFVSKKIWDEWMLEYHKVTRWKEGDKVKALKMQAIFDL